MGAREGEREREREREREKEVNHTLWPTMTIFTPQYMYQCIHTVHHTTTTVVALV